MNTITRKTSLPQVHPEQSWRSILETATIEVFELMASVRLQPLASSEGHPEGDTTAMVGMAGALCGMTLIRCSRQCAGKLAAKMLGGNVGTNQAAAGDALGELCNMVAGNFKAKFSTLADHCMLSVPTVIRGKDYSMQTQEPSETVVVALDYDGAAVWISLIVHT